MTTQVVNRGDAPVVGVFGALTDGVGHMLDSTGLTYSAPADDPYALKPADEMESEKYKATRVWRVRLSLILLLQLAVLILLVLQRYFYSTAVTGVMWIVGLVGVFWGSIDALVIYILFSVINFGKDIGIAWVFLDTKYAIATIAVDMTILVPYGIYCAFYYQKILGLLKLSHNFLEDN